MYAWYIVQSQNKDFSGMFSPVSMKVGNDSAPTEDDLAFENLYPALIECFAIIICG